MDDERFDGLTRALGAGTTRRGAVGLLAGLAGLGLGLAQARKKNRNGKPRKRGSARAGRVSAEAADCSSPEPSSNMNGCNFAGEDFSGDNLSGSSMVGTVFRNAELVGTNLASSTLRGANFRGADLCGADLSSSVLRNADFRGFADPGRVTNLTRADLSSSACGGIRTNARTVFCQTIGCDGEVINPDCPSCCADADCAPGGSCVDGLCEDLPICFGGASGSECACYARLAGGPPVCGDDFAELCDNTCSPENPCPNDGTVCTVPGCCPHRPGEGICMPPCPTPYPCVCGEGIEHCGDGAVPCGAIATAVRRGAAGAEQRSPRS